jgi:hydrogenase large subunit
MATTETPTTSKKVAVKEMSWDPITRIVGSLGIHTEIDFDAKKVEKAWSTSMIFRGFDIFMKGIDPRDAHFITSRICGICGDNHCTTSCLNQNMAYGVKPPALGDLGYNLAETADYMFDHAIFNDCMANVDFCEQMVRETNPTLLQKAEQTAAPGQDVHGYKTIADIMRALNPFTGDFYLETLQAARYTREMYCLFGGRHTHPSTIMPGGVSVDITHQTCTDYYVRLMRYIDYVKRAVPMHDDLYDFFLEELPGYDMVGYRDTDLVCWGYFDDPDYVDYDYRNMTEWGRKRYITPGVVLKGELITTDLVEINLMIRILLGSSYFDDWTNEETFVTQDPLGNPVDKRHPWNKVTLPKPQKRDWQDKYSWVASPRIYDERNDAYVACDTGGGPFARSWVTAKAGLVDFGYAKATGESIKMVLPRTASKPEMELEWKIPEKSNAIERDRARTYHEAFSALIGLHNLERALTEVRAGRTKSWNDFKVPDEAVSVGFCEAARGVLSHHMVIQDGKVANYQPYPPTPWNSNPRDTYGTPGPYEDAVQNTPIFEENGPEKFKGVDIMRAVRSFDPCLPCGVHMYNQRGGQVRKVTHTPTGMS